MMPKYSIIIPVKDRETNLACCLEALVRQTLPKEEWEVIVTDESKEVPWRAINTYKDELNLIYLLGPCLTGNPGLAKNWAVHNAEGEALIFIDSDVVINKEALKVYDELHTKYPESIIAGRYDWLMPMDVTPDDIADRFDEVVSNQLPIIHKPEPGPMPGIDPRWDSKGTPEWDKPARLSASGKPFTLALFGGNILIPKELFKKAGGFSSEIKGHGGEDNLLGWRLFEVGAEAMFSDKVIGWHIYHNRPQAQNEVDVRKNIALIESKYHDLHVKFGIIADTENKIVYCDDGTYVPKYERQHLGINK